MKPAPASLSIKQRPFSGSKSIGKPKGKLLQLVPVKISINSGSFFNDLFRLLNHSFEGERYNFPYKYLIFQFITSFRALNFPLVKDFKHRIYVS